MILGQSGRKCFGLLHTLKHTGTHAHRDTHILRDRHTYTEGHTHHGRLTPVSFCKQRTSTSRACHSCLPLPPLVPHTLPLLPPATATKLDDFQLCSTSLPPLPHDVASESSFSFFFLFWRCLQQSETFLRLTEDIYIHTHAHTHATCMCTLNFIIVIFHGSVQVTPP